MYFTFGWPKIFYSEIQEQFIDVSHNSDSSFIAFIGPTVLSLWSGDQHRVQLGYIARSDESINKFGKNQKLIWSPDSSSIAIVMDTGLDIMNFKLYKDNHSPYLQNDKKKMIIKFWSSFKPSTLGALCITSSHDYIFIFTKEGYLVKSSWTGELISQFPLDIVPFDDDEQGHTIQRDKLVVKSVFYNTTFSMFGLIFESGGAAILKKKSKDQLRGYWLCHENAVSISLNLKHRLAAVGLKNGDVLIYSLPGPVLLPSKYNITSPIKSPLSQNNSNNSTKNNNNNNNNMNSNSGGSSSNRGSIEGCKYLRTFSLLQFREITPDAIGPISMMKWTHDENCLAVGWKNRGFCLWSVYGCKLTCTIPQMNDISFSNRYLEPCKEGVLAFSWGPESYHLVLLSNGNENGEFFQFTFLKASTSSNPNLNHCERVILQTEDRLMLLNYKGKELGDIRWKHLQIPSGYLNDNWPIRHIALSRDRNQYAVAGRRGVILYNSLSKRWKMFGDRNQEQEIESHGLVWFKHTIVVANLNSSTKKFEFLFYTKQHLDNSSLLYQGNPLPPNQIPILIDCNDVHLAVLTNLSFFYLFKIKEITTVNPNNPSSSTSKIQLQLINLLSMAVPSPPLSISLLSTHIQKQPQSPNQNQQQQHLGVYCLILYASGSLCLSNAENSIQLEMSRDIEQYWFTNIYTRQDKDTSSSGNTLWAYGQSGIQVWFPFSSDEITSNKNLSNRSLSFDNEVYPIGFLNELGVIVGLSQGISYNSCSAYPNYEIHIKTHPFLHSILKHLLERGGVEKAWNLSSRFYTIPHFTHSLELLLHETISEDDKILPSQKLENVVNFLKKFPQFPEVSMRSARKIDATLWQGLFNNIGDPVQLYQKCLSNGKIEIAASYLKILQSLIGYDFSRKCAIELLEIGLDFDNIDLAGDLARFLHTTYSEEEEEKEMQKEKEGFSPTSSNSSATSASHTSSGSRIIKQMDSILKNYASKLLKSKLMRNFLLFSRKTMTETSYWLTSEKRSTILRTVEDLDMALNSIHVQFYINLPLDPIISFSPTSILIALTSSPAPSPTTSNNNLVTSITNNSNNISIGGEEENIEHDEDQQMKIPFPLSSSHSLPMIPGSRSFESLHQLHGLSIKDSDGGMALKPISEQFSSSSPTMVTKDEMIESLKSRITNTPIIENLDMNHSPFNSGVSGGLTRSNTIYSFKSHQFMYAPTITSNNDFNDPLFLKDSIDSSMDDLYYLLQELTNAGCYEWVLVIATVLLNTTLISKTLKRIPNIYENYCKMLSHQKPIGYTHLLKFVEEAVYPILHMSPSEMLQQMKNL
ncbi:hypothetical protein DLAC_03341 [Tieghemostelium lacteum]|uniref:RIC1 C-terminal alpha solenoid region domain-containing protein n=1 Tax=Tieghemostelium lacteum TaxID=361077 RepID=A0A152A260_TIELA|nr:hypothetical protein DLAC_03341 [Tieghemostelium lacteum]|eukprot:KYR00185.1 hypothetical protein DLAC_03341 [Tieghemostelium lacteum]